MAVNESQWDILNTDKASPEMLVEAIVRVYERYRGQGQKPGAEHWTSDSRIYRAKMVREVFLEWSTIVADDRYFPWHDDFVCKCWVDYRKTRREEKQAACEQFGLPFDVNASEA